MPKRTKQRPGDVPFNQPLYLITDSSDDGETEKHLTETPDYMKQEILNKRIKQEHEWNCEIATQDAITITKKKAKTSSKSLTSESNNAVAPLGFLARCLTLMETMERRLSKNKLKRKALKEQINEMTAQLVEKTSILESIEKDLKKERKRNNKMTELQNNELEICKTSVEGMKKEIEEMTKRKDEEVRVGQEKIASLERQVKRGRSDSTTKDEIRLDTTPGHFDESENERTSLNRTSNTISRSPKRRSRSPKHISRSPGRTEQAARLAYRDLRTHLKGRGIRNLPPPPPRWQPLSNYDRRSVAREIFRKPRRY